MLVTIKNEIFVPFVMRSTPVQFQNYNFDSGFVSTLQGLKVIDIRVVYSTGSDANWNVGNGTYSLIDQSDAVDVTVSILDSRDRILLESHPVITLNNRNDLSQSQVPERFRKFDLDDVDLSKSYVSIRGTTFAVTTWPKLIPFYFFCEPNPPR